MTFSEIIFTVIVDTVFAVLWYVIGYQSGYRRADRKWRKWGNSNGSDYYGFFR